MRVCGSLMLPWILVLGSSMNTHPRSPVYSLHPRICSSWILGDPDCSMTESERFLSRDREPSAESLRLMDGLYPCSLCGIIPGLSSVLLPRMNPFVLINVAGALSLCITYMLIEVNNYYNAVDTASAVAIALMTFGTMYPMSIYSGKVLLPHPPIIGQLDKLLREVSTLDGVLEVRNEHFWTVGFGSLVCDRVRLLGLAHVRIRRDANEQLVLAHVTNRLLPLGSTTDGPDFKDDWMRPLLTGAASLPPLGADPWTSTPSKHTGSPLPEFAFETPRKKCSTYVLATSGLHLPRPHYGLDLAYGPSHYTGGLNQGPVQSGFGLRPSHFLQPIVGTNSLFKTPQTNR
uniref:Solute carrier family 30 member 6 n=1 Tax=Takifugu rubripes TaxID=31033 RepID=A0A674MWK4_TAKRU